MPRVRHLQVQWAHEDITYGFVPASEEQIRAAFQGYFLVAELEGTVVGFVTASERMSDGLAVIPEGTKYFEIDDIYVIPDHRSRGIGSLLLERVKERAKRDGFTHLHVFSGTKDLHQILQFYERDGFRGWSVQLYQSIR